MSKNKKAFLIGCYGTILVLSVMEKMKSRKNGLMR